MKLTVSKVLTDEAIDRIADAILIMQEQGDTMMPVLKQQLQQCEAGIRNVMKAIAGASSPKPRKSVWRIRLCKKLNLS